MGAGDALRRMVEAVGRWAPVGPTAFDLGLLQDLADREQALVQFRALTTDPALVGRALAAMEFELRDGPTRPGPNPTVRQAANRVLDRMKRGYPPERPTDSEVRERWLRERGFLK